MERGGGSSGEVEGSARPPAGPFPARLPRSAQWAGLLAVSLVLVAVLELVRLPASLLLGAMAAAIAGGTAGATIRVHGRLFLLAQAIVGLLIARSFTPAIVAELGREWPVFLGGAFAVVAVSGIVGWAVARLGVLPGTMGVWGSAPGAAMAMTLMAEAHGEDIRLVAFMQYLRVVCVAVVASVVAALASNGAAPGAAELVWFPPIAWGSFAGTAALAALGAWVAPLLRIPAGALLLPLAAGTALQVTGTVELELPPWLLAISYALIGWSIGLRFTRPIFAHAARALPRILASIGVLIAACGGLGWLLAAVTGVDPLTAYLATTPGGADSVAIIAASGRVDVSFVMAMQTARFLAVLFGGPALARLVARLLPAPGGGGAG